MAIPSIPPEELAELGKVRAPDDYFAETRGSINLRPEKILCFVRKTQRQVVSEALERHHHHRYVLIAPWQESGEVYVDERRFLLHYPQALLIFPFQFHHGFHFSRQKMLWQFSTFELNDGAALETLRLSPLRKLRPDDFRLMAALAAAWNQPRRQDELSDWLALILKRMMKAPSAIKEGQLVNSPNANSLLLKINQYCLLHLHELFGLKKLADHLSISESHLRASFRRETGMSLGQHLRRLRLQKAMGLLLQSNLSITQVAERCGFDSIFTFSRSFRRFTGLVARDYRRQFAGSHSPKPAGNRKS
jgi:AraC-like DNA-binding protein